jgi:hypothetical protein
MEFESVSAAAAVVAVVLLGPWRLLCRRQASPPPQSWPFSLPACQRLADLGVIHLLQSLTLMPSEVTQNRWC